MSPTSVPKWHGPVNRVSRLAASVLLLWLAVMALPLAITGLRWTGMSEVVNVGEAPFRSELVFYQPYPAAWGYVISGGLIAIGRSKRKALPLAWLGTVALVVWSGIWLFSSGAAFLPLAGLMLLLLVILSITRSRLPG